MNTALPLTIADGPVDPIDPQPVTEEFLQRLRERNERRAKEMIDRMGESYRFHPSRRVRRKEAA